MKLTEIEVPRYHSSFIQSLLEVDTSVDVRPGEASYRAESTPKQTFQALKNGKIMIDKRYSFRGMQLSEAEQALDDIMMNTQKASCYLLVHGKGIGSSKQQPKIKYLLQNKLYGHLQVIAYCEACVSDGGSGAMYVMLSAYLR